MKQVIVELDDQTVEQLEQVAPGRSRQRSEFIRTAIRKALWEAEEHRTAEAYRKQPDAGDPYLDPRVWEAAPSYRGSRRKRP